MKPMKPQQPHKPTTPEFPGPSRMHVALGVSDLEASTAFYRKLLGTEPAKQRTGYAKFETVDPPLNLALNQLAGAVAPRPREFHFGIQVKSTSAVAAAAARLESAGLAVEQEQGVACCYAVQDKVWVVDPDHHAWEVFVVTEAESPHYASHRQDSCCSDATDDTCCEDKTEDTRRTKATEGACC